MPATSSLTLCSAAAPRAAAEACPAALAAAAAFPTMFAPASLRLARGFAAADPSALRTYAQAHWLGTVITISLDLFDLIPAQ